jgi:CDP-glycerol glycerophosphotransferase
MVLYRNILFNHRSRLYKKFYKLPTDSKVIVFEAFMGRQFACSPKAVYKRMLADEKYKDFTLVWAFRKPKDFSFLEKYPNTIVVKYNKSEYFRYMGMAKYWITNSRIPDSIKKKDDQVYIQCWHGTPLKKLGYDIEVAGENAINSKDDLNKKYSDDSIRYTYMISPSEFSSEKFASAFKLQDPSIIQTIGYPRNDFLSNYTQDDIDAIMKKLTISELAQTNSYKDIDNLKKDLSIDSSKKIILYAPTWRDNQHISGQGYTYDLNIDFGKLREEFGDEYIILFRAHYFISNNIDLSEYEGFVYDVSKYDDINELYVISDILITDYSSVFFDYANLKRPIMFYMYDFDEYKNNMRDFYIDIDELPGPIAKTQNELIEAIKNVETYQKDYGEKYKAFYDKYDYLDDGNASQRLLDICIK